MLCNLLKEANIEAEEKAFLTCLRSCVSGWLEQGCSTQHVEAVGELLGETAKTTSVLSQTAIQQVGCWRLQFLMQHRSIFPEPDIVS